MEIRSWWVFSRRGLPIAKYATRLPRCWIVCLGLFLWLASYPESQLYSLAMGMESNGQKAETL